MAAIKNHVIYDADPDRLEALAQEYTFLGREVVRRRGSIVVLALPRSSKRAKKIAAKQKRLKEARGYDPSEV